MSESNIQLGTDDASTYSANYELKFFPHLPQNKTPIMLRLLQLVQAF